MPRQFGEDLVVNIRYPSLRAQTPGKAHRGLSADSMLVLELPRGICWMGCWTQALLLRLSLSISMGTMSLLEYHKAPWVQGTRRKLYSCSIQDRQASRIEILDYLEYRMPSSPHNITSSSATAQVGNPVFPSDVCYGEQLIDLLLLCGKRSK